jgi:hypothetical protein
MAVPSKVGSRISSGLKRFQPILDAARARDANESDTVIIVMDLLHEILGYDKYGEITSSSIRYEAPSARAKLRHCPIQRRSSL